MNDTRRSMVLQRRFIGLGQRPSSGRGRLLASPDSIFAALNGVSLLVLANRNFLLEGGNTEVKPAPVAPPLFEVAGDQFRHERINSWTGVPPLATFMGLPFFDL
jgi:hypothetical protein